MITKLTEDSLHKIEMIALYRKDIERFTQTNALVSVEEFYGNYHISFSGTNVVCKEFTELTQKAQSVQDSLDTIKKESTVIFERIKNYKKGIFGKSKDEIVVSGYFDPKNKSDIYQNIEMVNVAITELLVILQDFKDMYGEDEYMISFFEIPTSHDEFIHFGNTLEQSHHIIEAILQYTKELHKKFETMFEVVFIDSFSDFGEPQKTLKKILSTTGIVEGTQLTVKEFIHYVSTYCAYILTEIPENLPDVIVEYRGLLQNAVTA